MYLGLDLGTSGLKGVVIDDAQKIIAEATAPLTVSRPQDGWSEQSPADWIVAAEAVLNAMPVKVRAAIRGIGLSGQMHGATLLDAADNVLRPCILWNDTRSHAEAAALDASSGVRDLSGTRIGRMDFVETPGELERNLAVSRAAIPCQAEIGDMAAYGIIQGVRVGRPVL